MPELPDVTVYIESLESRLIGQPLERIEIKNPFLLRTAEPPLTEFEGKRVRALRRLGKRVAIQFEGDLWLVFHLMIAGRFHWSPDHKGKIRPPIALLRFANGTLTLTEAGTKRRASLHAVRGERGLDDHDRGGLEVLDASFETFNARIHESNHTLKRALTDPAIFSGIGNAYSDEILHRARLSPLLQTKFLDDARARTLYVAVRESMKEWTQRLREIAGKEFPEGVTAFREGMAVHGRYCKPCPVCGTDIQRIRYAENETNYCPRCQTDGKLLADRSLSRLLKDDWPKTIDMLENKRRGD
ncbi:MAG TPA: DNA-formamidopyrimidine glycosylase family protein [Steroidobacteraceae bacterium]|nr:DNA-formamidopyrimidine glycosylase family protein [Steroidobacteraceae bacterium]